MLIIFFFQAEDGIRALYVTGVQTCALPISRCWRAPMLIAQISDTHIKPEGRLVYERSEERRVGKECRSRWPPYHLKKNDKMAALWFHFSCTVTLPRRNGALSIISSCISVKLWYTSIARAGGNAFSTSFFFSSRRRHTRSLRDWSSDVCSSDLLFGDGAAAVVVSGNGARGPKR